jgi:hypothetical protein
LIFTYDPYDVWSTEKLGQLKVSYLLGKVTAKLAIPFIGLFEMFAPIILRRLLKIEKHNFPHVDAIHILSSPKHVSEYLRSFSDSAITTEAGTGWGLPFKWYSKNGVYPSDTPFITNTPYVMEALVYKDWHDLNNRAMEMFNSTWGFLESLIEIIATEHELALSYSPIAEPRIVINANSYSALAYALHFIYGRPQNKIASEDKVKKLVRWIISQQGKDGSWYYYADEKQGNFIDCFHSCFIVKNLIKIKKLMPEFAIEIDAHILLGWSFIQKKLYDDRSGLCYRFTESDIKSPFKWDLYDQAEYLGLLIDFGAIQQAIEFAEHVKLSFLAGKTWYTRIDILNRKWGKNFRRWGIEPFLYHEYRLRKIQEKEVS